MPGGRVSSSDEIRLLLCGDVMLGRGIDQILPHPGDPALPESLPRNRDARLNVALAELMHGALPKDRDPTYVWGDALEIFEAGSADARIINLETAITAGGVPWPDKPIHYRMHPQNVEVLKGAGIDVCALANNHTLDYSHEGLLDTLGALNVAGIRHAGAGRNRQEADAPAVLELPGKGRLLLISLATQSSGVPAAWAATPERPGLGLIELTDEWFDYVRARLRSLKQPGDLLVVSIHWGDNYIYRSDGRDRAFARRLIDAAGVDLVHGHSPHHVRGIEIHRERPILYGCGDLINDYEGTLKRPHRILLAPELGLIYLVRFAVGEGQLLGLEMYPTRMHRLQVRRAGSEDARRLAALMNREGAEFGTRVIEEAGVLKLQCGDT